MFDPVSAAIVAGIVLMIGLSLAAPYDRSDPPNLEVMETATS